MRTEKVGNPHNTDIAMVTCYTLQDLSYEGYIFVELGHVMQAVRRG
jgi:hypothetical protein